MSRLLHRWTLTLASLVLLLFGSGVGLVLHAHEPHACPPGVPDTPSFSEHLRHEAIAAGDLSFQQIFEAGGRLFAAVFNVCDGQGRPAATGAGKPTKRLAGSAPDFLRTSAPDANSCAGCHNQPRPGGAGDFVANVFVLAQTLDPVTFDVSHAFSNERNTLGMNGAGAIELLAREMTADLQAIRDEAIRQAHRLRRPVTRALQTKRIRFGRITAFPDGRVDASQVEGVDRDLVIRPFHQSGGVVSVREFTVNAMNHHHGMQAVERFGPDFDEDGVPDELTVGDITAVTIWQAAQNIPGELIARRKARHIRQGERIFTGIGCATCHVPALVLDNPIFCEPNPLNPPGTFNDTSQPFCFDLTREGPKPRLERLGDGRARVRSFTDLKRHRICDDQDPHFCNERLLPPGGRSSTAEFLTRKLWDVGSSAPYGHRGDLTTITEAILAHGAEGRSAKQAFMALRPEEQVEVIEFLKSLQILPEGSERVVHVDDH
jgi:hypothetical protein